MANKYRSVLASGGGVQPTGNAQPADVLSGKTFSNADGIDKTGTMPNRGAVSGTATPSQPYTIPAGFHNGSGTVTASETQTPAGIIMRCDGVYYTGTSVSGSVASQDFQFIANIGNATKMSYSFGNILNGKILKKDGTYIDANILTATGTNVDVSDYVTIYGYNGNNGAKSASLS